jgi:dephospho-CoA kinase
MVCAGKNHVGRLLERRGIPVLDVDKLGHQALEEEKEAVVSRFGPGVLDGEGKISRRALGEMVFGRPDELSDLEAIVHPAVNRLTQQWMEEQRGICVINAAVLHKSSAFSRLDALILVQAPLITRLIRARKRDHLPWRALFRRFWSQRSFEAQYSNLNVDKFIVRNGGFSALGFRFGERALDKRIDAILRRLAERRMS